MIGKNDYQNQSDIGNFFDIKNGRKKPSNGRFRDRFYIFLEKWIYLLSYAQKLFSIRV